MEEQTEVALGVIKAVLGSAAVIGIRQELYKEEIDLELVLDIAKACHKWTDRQLEGVLVPKYVWVKVLCPLCEKISTIKVDPEVEAYKKHCPHCAGYYLMRQPDMDGTWIEELINYEDEKRREWEWESGCKCK